MEGLQRIAEGLYVLAVHTSSGQQRDPARAQLREAVRTALASLPSVPPEQITIHATPGSAPHIDAAGRKVGCSFSHEDGLSLAALNLHGPVGIDLMKVQDIPDWESVARDYLGPETCAALSACRPQDRPRAFAQAWTAHEARLKCQGLPLTEWPAPTTTPQLLHLMELTVPADLIATLAWGQH
jgi:4'-phosphopantetheinyl transferase